MNSSEGFAAHCLGLLKTRGPSGPTPDKSLSLNDKVGTTRPHEVGPVKFEWSQDAAASGTNKGQHKQAVTRAVTSGTSGTTNFARAVDRPALSAGPPEWHAILAELNDRDPVDGFSLERWRQLLRDGESFISKWGQAASGLGWTALDLFGVHPAAPAARMDVLGLIVTLSGGEIVNLTEGAATIRRRSGAVLTYRKGDQSDAVLLSEVRS